MCFLLDRRADGLRDLRATTVGADHEASTNLRLAGVIADLAPRTRPSVSIKRRRVVSSRTWTFGLRRARSTRITSSVSRRTDRQKPSSPGSWGGPIADVPLTASALYSRVKRGEPRRARRRAHRDDSGRSRSRHPGRSGSTAWGSGIESDRRPACANPPRPTASPTWSPLRVRRRHDVDLTHRCHLGSYVCGFGPGSARGSSGGDCSSITTTTPMISSPPSTSPASPARSPVPDAAPQPVPCRAG